MTCCPNEDVSDRHRVNCQDDDKYHSSDGLPSERVQTRPFVSLAAHRSEYN